MQFYFVIICVLVQVIERCQTFVCQLTSEEIPESVRTAHSLYESLTGGSKQSHISGDLNMRKLIHFFLYTRKNGDGYQLFAGDNFTLSQSNFNEKIPTIFIIHGYKMDPNQTTNYMSKFMGLFFSGSILNVKDALLIVGDFNVIVVNWPDIAFTLDYAWAAGQTETVGHYVARFIDFLVDEGVSPGDIHIIGYSLGAHVAGFAGANVTSGKVARISGLDPAKPCFYYSPIDRRLDGSDAEFVDCIHTCGDSFGLMEPICTADFYPNGGTSQPGCLLDSCHHSRALEYYAESISPGNKFHSKICDSVPFDSVDSCSPSKNLMGYGASPEMVGIFYAETRGTSPYSFNSSMSTELVAGLQRSINLKNVVAELDISLLHKTYKTLFSRKRKERFTTTVKY